MKLVIGQLKTVLTISYFDALSKLIIFLKKHLDYLVLLLVLNNFYGF